VVDSDLLDQACTNDFERHATANRAQLSWPRRSPETVFWKDDARIMTYVSEVDCTWFYEIVRPDYVLYGFITPASPSRTLSRRIVHSKHDHPGAVRERLEKGVNV
jgi:hypothetical protein